MTANLNWTREEHLLAFNLYCQIPFGRFHNRNPVIQHLAGILGRSVNSVALKLSNFARLDPALQARGIHGMAHGAKGEVEVWDEFRANPEALAFESLRLMADRLGKSVETYADVETRDLPAAGVEREAIVRLRVNQSFFRRRVLSAYDDRCCVTGIAHKELLTASHIVPWAIDPANRLNPRNGLCLNALHDRAFDRGLMWVDDDFTIRFAPRLLSAPAKGDEPLRWMCGFQGKQLQLPEKFTPDLALLRRHADAAKSLTQSPRS